MGEKGITGDALRNKFSEETQELHRQLKKKDDILENYKKSHGQLEVFFNRVLGEITPVAPIPNYFEKEHKTRIGQGSAISAVFHVTDSHMGSVQEPDEIEGFNEFNPAICDERNKQFALKGVDWVKLHRNSYSIPTCHVLFTGDLISGDIHEELKVTNAFPSPEQVVRAAQSHAVQLALLATNFEHVTVEFITEDNHARLTKKPQAKEAGKNSLNYLVGKMLELYMSKHDNITFNLHPQNEKVIHVLNRNYLIKHGHGIKAWMGIPWYGIERSLARESTARQNLIMQDVQRAHDLGFHKMIFGHFHTPFDHWLYSCGGSVSGTDAYDHQAGRYSPPTQSAWFVHPKHGEFDRINFNLSI